MRHFLLKPGATVIKGFREFTGALLFAFFLVYLYDYTAFGTSQHASLMPWIQVLRGKLNFSDDFNLQAFQYYHVNFSHLVAFLSQGIPLPTVFLLGFFLCLIGYYFGISNLSSYLFPQRRVFYFAVVLLLLWNSRGIESNTFWQTRQFEAPMVANVMCLFGFGFLLREAYILSAVSFGLGFVFHVQIGLDALLIAAAFLILYFREAGMRNVIRFTAAYLLFFVPVIWQHAPVLFDSQSSLGGSFIELAKFRIAHHVTLRPERFFPFLFMFLAGGIVWLVSFKFNLTAPGDKKKYTKAALLSVLLFGSFLAHYFFFYVVPWDFAVKLQLLRISPFFHLFAVLFLARILIRWMEDRSVTVNLFALNLLLFLFFHIFHPKTPLPEWPFYAAGSLLLLIAAKKILPEHGRKTFWFLLAPAFALLMSKAFLAEKSEGWKFRAPRCLQLPVETYDVRNAHPIWPWMNVCHWIKQHTEKDAVFITPPYFYGFIFYAERRMIAEFKMNPLARQSDIREWEKRIRDLNRGNRFTDCQGMHCVDVMIEEYNRLSPVEVLRIGHRYGARYFVTVNPQPYPFKKIYENEAFHVYRLELK